ncbi:hypothetical protein EV121DRAFT_218336 [Schizophyllum commune]
MGPLGPRAQRKDLPPRDGQFGFTLPQLPQHHTEWQAPIEDANNPDNPFLVSSSINPSNSEAPEPEPSAIQFSQLYNITDSSPLSTPSTHRQKKLKQHARWVNEVIPSLTTAYMELRSSTANLRESPPSYTPFSCSCRSTCHHCSCRGGCAVQSVRVIVLRFMMLEEITVHYSKCNPVATQLMQCGIFPCAPLRPSFAVDINVLDFARLLYLQTAPNDTAWCQATEIFLGDRGYKLRFQDNLRRRFGSCMLWYSYLLQVVRLEVDNTIAGVRQRVVPGTEPQPTPACGLAARSIDSRLETIEEEDTPRARTYADDAHTPVYGRLLTGSPPERKTPRSSGRSAKRKRNAEPQAVPPNPFPDPPSRDMCSEFLRRRCPACFGGHERVSSTDGISMPDIIVCLDACYTQKHNRTAYRDEELPNSDAVLVSEDVVDAIERHVNSIRPPASKRPKASTAESEDDQIVQGLKVANSTLATCEKSFKAANGAVVKASREKHDVVSVMALVCRHDVALFVANMTTPGEQQFYAFALIESLMQHIPLSWTVGLLYDVACTLHASCVKWGYLSRYMDRLWWGISVFHAYGHHYPCQLIYHPRKCLGFGLTDREGCERFWHSLSRLIAYLRVCGYFRRNFTLDAQIRTLADEHLLRLGDWQQRKSRNCARLRTEAEADLAASGQPVEVLQAQWESQVKTQTAPLPRQSQNQGKKAIDEALRLSERVDVLAERLTRLEDVSVDADMPEPTRAEARILREDVRADLQRTQSTLQAKIAELGNADHEELCKRRNSVFLNVRMNMLALMQRIYDKIIHRKHETHRISRAVGKQKKQRLIDHTLKAVEGRDSTIASLIAKFNKKVGEQEDLIRKGKAPPNAKAMTRLPTKGIFDVDVDSEIWLPLRARIHDDSGSPPPWLADENVRKGIQAMLTLQRCKEEEKRLQHETRNLRTWFSMEWKSLQKTCDVLRNSPAMLHEIEQRKMHLLRLYARWNGKLLELPGLPSWGPSGDALQQAEVDWASTLIADSQASVSRAARSSSWDEVDDDQHAPLVDDTIDYGEEVYDAILVGMYSTDDDVL